MEKMKINCPNCGKELETESPDKVPPHEGNNSLCSGGFFLGGM